MVATEKLEGLEYTLEEWQADRLSFEAACPRCGKILFYGAYPPEGIDAHLELRPQPGDRKYRLCKFCGLYQEPGKTAVQAKPVAHMCKDQSYELGAAYIQWHPEGDTYTCFWCHEEEIPVDSSLVPSPCETPDHPWGQYK